MNRIEGRDDSQLSLVGLRHEGSPPTPRSLRLGPPNSSGPPGGSLGPPGGPNPMMGSMGLGPHHLGTSSEDLRRYTPLADSPASTVNTPAASAGYYHTYSPGYCIYTNITNTKHFTVIIIYYYTKLYYIIIIIKFCINLDDFNLYEFFSNMIIKF